MTYSEKENSSGRNMQNKDNNPDGIGNNIKEIMVQPNEAIKNNTRINIIGKEDNRENHKEDDSYQEVTVKVECTTDTEDEVNNSLKNIIDNKKAQMYDQCTLNTSNISPSKMNENCLIETSSKNNSLILNTCNSNKSEVNVSESDDIDLADVKLEYSDNNILGEFEAIDLLHDIDSVLDFKDSKVSSNSLSFTPNKAIQETVAKSNAKRKLEMMLNQEKLTAVDKDALLKLRIKLVHKIPPQHKIENNVGSRQPTLMEKKQFLKYGPLKKGTFSPTEDEIIINNWKLFCKNHSWNENNVYPFLYWRHNGKYYIKDKTERKKFVQFLANGLPWRTLYSVYFRFRLLQRNKKPTSFRYTPEEDETIIEYMEGEDSFLRTSCTELADILGRTRCSIWARYELLKKGKVKKEKSQELVTWTLALIKKYIKTLLKITLSSNIAELKGAVIPKVIWLKMERKLNISHTVLKQFWLHQLHMQLFCPDTIYLNDIKIQLIEYMYGKGISHMREIVWSEVVSHFDGMTTMFLCSVFFHLVNDCPIKSSTNNFSDIIEYLYHEKILILREEETDKHLPRLQYLNDDVSLLE